MTITKAIFWHDSAIVRRLHYFFFDELAEESTYFAVDEEFRAYSFNHGFVALCRAPSLVTMAHIVVRESEYDAV